MEENKKDQKERNGAYIEIRKNSIRFYNPDTKRYTYNNLASFKEWFAEALERMNQGQVQGALFGSAVGTEDAYKWKRREAA